MAPVETIAWWLRQDDEQVQLNTAPTAGFNGFIRSVPASPTSINCYIVFFPGVGDFAADDLSPGQTWLIDRLVEQHPNCIAVKDVFPYSVASNNLGELPIEGALWKAAWDAEGWLNDLDVLVKIRNLWQFAMSADDRYSPIYSQGIAKAVVDRMNAAHPISPHQPINIILMGTSGGVQIALGAAPYLKDSLNAKLTVISLGGCFDGGVGLQSVQRMYHLHGQYDWVDDVGAIIFPSRWQWVGSSSIDEAKKQERYEARMSGPHTHDGETGYFGLGKLENSRSAKTYVQLTLEQLNQLPIWAEMTLPNHKQI
ncbi:hypothetical protein ACQ4M3_06105 [Leptolyngbya sp. AN03gr2]|uniref:hypothetical protein n=1 Tax=unclassified Leptolyngbya TaxID=2650499 RepID=UPI003D322803